MAATGGTAGYFYIFSSFFLTIATTLGTGILALPVKLSQTGFGPAVAVFAVVLCMELAVVWLFIALLQYTQVLVGRPAKAPEEERGKGCCRRGGGGGGHGEDTNVGVK